MTVCPSLRFSAATVWVTAYAASPVGWSRWMPARHRAASTGSTDSTNAGRARPRASATALLPAAGSPHMTISTSAPCPSSPGAARASACPAARVGWPQGGMSGSRPQPSARHHRRQIKLSLYRSPRRSTRLSESTMPSRFHASLLSGGVTLHQGEVVGLHVFDRLAVARDDVGQTTHARGDVVADRGQSRVRLGGDGAVVEADQTEVCGDVLADDVSGTERCGGRLVVVARQARADGQ